MKKTDCGWYWAMRTNSPEKFKEIVYVSQGMAYSVTGACASIEKYTFYNEVKRPDFPDEEAPHD